MNDLAQIKHLLQERNFEIVLELGPTSTVPRPTASEIQQHIQQTAAGWADGFDALVVVITGHGHYDKLMAWPSDLSSPERSGPLDLKEAVFSQFQLPPQKSTVSATLASERLKGKPKIFIVDACRSPDGQSGEMSAPLHPLVESSSGHAGGGIDGLTKGEYYEAMMDSHSDTFTRYSDFLFCFATTPFNESGVLGSSSNFLGSLIHAMKDDPIRLFTETLTAASRAMLNFHARNSGKLKHVNFPHTAEISPNTLRKGLKFTTPHFIRDVGALHLRGRNDDLNRLEDALRGAAAGHQLTPARRHYFVLGAAGLGKTELVTWATRALVRDPAKRVSDGTPSFLYSAVVFVELRARDSEELCRTAIEEAMRKASLPPDNGARGYGDLRDALIVLDNADDPFWHESNQDNRWFEGQGSSTGVLRELESCEPGAILITLRDKARRLISRIDLKNAYIQELDALSPEAGRELLADEMPDAKPELDGTEVDDILTACGARGVSPLALKVVSGVLRRKEEDWDGEKDRRSEYLRELKLKIANTDEFSEVQEVMRISFGYLNHDLRRQFLKLHLFPDQFTREDAACLLEGDEMSASKGTRRTPDVLDELVKFNLVTRTKDASTGSKVFLILDHIWVFAASQAEDPDSLYLSREEYADAVWRFLQLAGQKSPADRMFDAAKFHALHITRLFSKFPRIPGDGDMPHYRPLSPSAHMVEHDAPQYRSLNGNMNAYDQRKRPNASGGAPGDTSFCPLKLETLLEQTRRGLETAAAKLLKNDEACALSGHTSHEDSRKRARGDTTEFFC